jgi:hypothetical protein
MNSQRVPEPEPFFVSTTPQAGAIEEYVIREFARVRGKRPRRVDVVLAPHEVGVLIYLDEVTEEDRAFAERLERSLSRGGEPAMVVPTAGTGIPTR